MRASRLVSLLLLLQTRGRMSATQLAAELGVTSRTVYRDVEALITAGVPIYAEHGPTGGYQLLDGYRTRLTGLTADEAETLFLTGMPLPAAELGFGAQLAAAELKLMAALPTPYRDASMRIRERFHLDAPGWFREPDAVPYLLAVAEAVWRELVVEVGYRRWAPTVGVVRRRLHPLGLVLKAGIWYLVAAPAPSAADVPPRSADENASGPSDGNASGRGGHGRVRTYRVSKILDLIVTEEPGGRPEGFDLVGYWQDHVDRYEAITMQATAVVRLSPDAVRVLPDLFGSKISRAALDGADPPDENGWRRVPMLIESIEHAATDLLRLGAGCQVLGPPELVARIRQTLLDTLAHYP